jgi:Nif-specific regulatory protein
VSEGADLQRVHRERDLFFRLLQVGLASDARPYATEVLSLLVDATGAQRGFLAVDGEAESAPLLEVSRGLDDGEREAVRASLSSGIIGEALRTGATVSTASAATDPRYSAFASVQAGRIQAVLCAPLRVRSPRGEDLGSIGVLYLAGRSTPGPFPESDRALCELAAGVIGPRVEELLCRVESPREPDHTSELRARLPSFSLAGRSRALADVMRQVLAAAAVPVAVLLRGESGTGKSVVARALHDASARRAKPFVEVNVAALPETLFEGELFGAERGAHSQAHQRIVGKIEAAEGGTLFLDEIGELPLSSQTKLLSFLQTKRYMRLGGTQSLLADVRILAATNRELETAVRDKTFREDLYYRLNVLEIVLPPLRARVADVAPIAELVAERLGSTEAPALPLSSDAKRALAEAEWPGNVRQLENVVARGWANALADGSFAIEPHHLFGRALSEGQPARPPESEDAPIDFHARTRQFQAELVERALTQADWNVSETARRLSLSRSRLNELIRSFGLTRRGR